MRNHLMHRDSSNAIQWNSRRHTIFVAQFNLPRKEHMESLQRLCNLMEFFLLRKRSSVPLRKSIQNLVPETKSSTRCLHIYMPAPLQVLESGVLRAINHFPLGSAGGNSGPRPNHLLELSKVEHCSIGTTFLDSLTQFVSYFLSGKAPTQLGPRFCGALLTALQKKNSGITPIAVGENLRPPISSCTLKKVSSPATKIFQPFQLGIATKNGTEVVLHAVRRVCQQYGKKLECGKLSIDLTNAFNLVSRNAFFA